jgi:hypothetical protein
VNDEARLQTLMREMVSIIARQKAVRPGRHPRAPAASDLDADRLWRFTACLTDSLAARNALMKFAGWLWKTGTHDNQAILEIVEDCVRRRPESPYRYYSPGGKARNEREATVAIQFAERENAAFKAADRSFLGLDDSPRDR